MYDLYMDDKSAVKQYNYFHRELIKLGFYRIQYSIYCKVLHNKDHCQNLINKITRVLPKKGQVRILTITEKQYQNMYILSGERTLHENVVGNKRIVYIGDEDGLTDY